MAFDEEERIRIRAYQIWEEAGRPHGLDKQHWEQCCSGARACRPETCRSAN
ncbi:DUF2934 domain-containing protein [Sinorhizobium meliloti]|uniref:DUF2934 domain-containing protein n=1 Tax=Rhizobium meliloti TaxID=382 RepID=UPI000FD7CD47|nr:DUF2934 domain-containing protein [Sinorhizobium meliloti]RVO23329.1 DUF2934 domain-containing protein [Sinorhizobium meliloti]